MKDRTTLEEEEFVYDGMALGMKPDRTTPEEYAEFVYGMAFGLLDDDGKLPFKEFVERVAEVIRWAIAEDRRQPPMTLGQVQSDINRRRAASLALLNDAVPKKGKKRRRG